MRCASAGASTRLEDLCSGPGKLTQALGIGLDLNGTDLIRGPIAIASRPRAWRDVRVVAEQTDRHHQGRRVALALLGARQPVPVAPGAVARRAGCRRLAAAAEAGAA